MKELWLTNVMKFVSAIMFFMSLLSSAYTLVTVFSPENALFYLSTSLLTLPLSGILYQLCKMREDNRP